MPGACNTHAMTVVYNLSSILHILDAGGATRHPKKGKWILTSAATISGSTSLESTAPRLERQLLCHSAHARLQNMMWLLVQLR